MSQPVGICIQHYLESSYQMRNKLLKNNEREDIFRQRAGECVEN